VLEKLKSESEERQKYFIDLRYPEKGFPYVCLPGSVTALVAAMSVGSPEVVRILLENGADPYICDGIGNDPLLCACTQGRLVNARFWLNHFRNWDLSRKNKIGATALSCAVFFGPNRRDLVELLISKGAATNNVTYVLYSLFLSLPSLHVYTHTHFIHLNIRHNGTSTLMSACMNEDADCRVVELLLQRSCEMEINRKVRPQTTKWHAIYLTAKLAVRSGISKSILMQSLADRQGRTALHYAARRGDLEIVEFLLRLGGNVSAKDSAGRNVRDVCTGFPELRGVLEKRERKMKLRGTTNKAQFVESLGKRISTATPIQHEMWLISLETLLMLYGNAGKGRVMEVHQELIQRGFLTRWQDTPSDAEIVFVSHEWLSWAHPDPNGDQLQVLCRVLERLKKGRLDTEMDPMHTILYKHKFTTRGKDWEAMLRRTYLWVDWFSMPQPSAEKEDKIGTERMAKLRVEGSRAIRSIPAYVERSDFIMVLVPGCYHVDRKVPTCFRSWRRRGWCLLELYAAAMARDSSNPPLLVRSERGTPMWMSPLEVMKLSIGLADFTCCQRNHVITTETQKIMSGGKVKKIPCDKPIAGGILEQLINAKINHLFNAEGDLVMARFHFALKQWWMRGIKEQEVFVADKSKSAVEKFKKKLRWKDDESWFDCGGIGIVIYAICSNEVKVVEELLES